MKILKLSLLSFSLLFLFNCKKEEPTKNTTSKTEEATEPEFHKEYYGIYTGDFEGTEKTKDEVDGEVYDLFSVKKLYLKINRITKDSVYGHTTVNGKQRPFRGILNNDTKSFILDEPGNDKTDGRFEIKLEKDSVKGKWTPFNSSAVKADFKTLKLAKKEFAYNPNLMISPNMEYIDWDTPKEFKESYEDEDGKTQYYNSSKNRVSTDAIFNLNASKNKLTEKQLKNLNKLDLEIIKNTVYARHGYNFKNKTFRYFFEASDWYVPMSDNVDAELSPIEKENVALLNRFAKYAEDKYESFSR